MAGGFWPQEELKAEKDLLYLTKAAIKHKAGCFSTTGFELGIHG